MAGIYVHIPFCARRCLYCGFFSTTRHSETGRYTDALCKELSMMRGWFSGRAVHTVYFGGGTPSQLSLPQLSRILNEILSMAGSAPDELTVECNPDDLDLQFAAGLREIGFDRISMGVQTFDDGLLRFLGRRHTAQQAADAVRTCRDAGFKNISIDLMYGLPGQSAEMQQHDLETATGLGVQHISSYCLSYEEGSPLERMRLEGRLTPQSDDTCAEMFSRMCAHMKQAGYEHYEISNFALPGFRSRHNSSYWDGTPYLGLGAGAHSYDGHVRRWNVPDLDAYVRGIEDGCPECGSEELTATDLFNEKLMLGLRTCDGAQLSEDGFGLISRAAAPYIAGGQLIWEKGRLRIAEDSLFISDRIISDLFLD